ncbi:hypothetical protein [Gallibacterium anatis]|uniref:Transferrin-binding protein B C-lobe/N-lobe beta barrel domain-containing protein n=1 Tax=Gallibacterium anatis 12656/12 TaxID=1195244 RepID=U1GXX2_9PAST|nr:hypothetical protein [Gallibacterium anatis]ERF77363.1 hypothetical protein N561_11905 [Gallibacterium anatis 12656/12]KGQ24825.1 hypothetical protein JP31_08335 [Gallibacterium anatis]KGQ28111.1 hypothetical protein JP27_04430 [Gallibacterium anatis]KGQ30880.1 hypothetical protein JP34_11350 [Gallibacterium anatis]
MHLPIKISSLALFVTFSLTACGSSGGGSGNSNKNETVANNPQIVQNEKALQTQLEKLKQQQTRTQKNLEDERQKLAKKEKELQDLKSNNQIDQEKLSSLQKDLEQNKARVSSLEKTLSEQQTEAAQARRNLEAQLAAANSALNEKSKALEDLQNNQNADQAALQKAQTELKASQSEVEKLNRQLEELKQLYPQAEFAMGSRVRIDSKHYSKLSESLSGLLPNTQKMTDEQVTRNILFAPKIAGKLMPQGQIQRHQITQKVNGKDVEMDYFSYHYNEDDTYLAEVWSDNSLGYVSVVAYGGKATPIEKFDAFKQAQVVKEYDVKMAPGTGRYWDSYDTTFTADFGNEKISGIAKKIDLNNAFTANEDIIFPEQPIFVKDDAIRFGGNKPSVKIKFKHMEDTMKYEGIFIGENAEKIVGRVGGSSLIGKEKE